MFYLTSQNVDWTTLQLPGAQVKTYSIPSRSMTAWTSYSNGSQTFDLVAGRRYRVEARGAVPGTAQAEHILLASGMVSGTLASVTSLGGNVGWAGFLDFVPTTTGAQSLTLSNRASSNMTGTAQTITVMVTQVG